MWKIVEMNERTTASCESIARREEKAGCSIEEVMTLVEECGATPKTDEHFIATIIFTKKAERQMFMTLKTPDDRFDGLKRKYEWLSLDMMCLSSAFDFYLKTLVVHHKLIYVCVSTSFNYQQTISSFCIGL